MRIFLRYIWSISHNGITLGNHTYSYILFVSRLCLGRLKNVYQRQAHKIVVLNVITSSTDVVMFTCGHIASQNVMH